MSHNKMLIDATHPEETRVVVLRDGRVEEFDYESAARKLLRGNIYLAKVTRVEPSLQAAFVDYGGNRHGFLAFNEIHPDYYQIPMADRQALLDEEAAAEAAEEAAADAHAERMARRRQRQQGGPQASSNRDTRTSEDAGHSDHDEDQDQGHAGHDGQDDHDHHDDRDDDNDHDGDHGHDGEEDEGDEDRVTTLASAEGHRDDVHTEDLPEPEVVGGFEPPSLSEEAYPGDDDDREPDDVATGNGDAPEAIGLVENETVEVVAAAAPEPETVETGAEDALEELPSRPRRRPRSYKIQEVIKRRQVILVQVVKEERGNKGAALTTYLSLAGRYTVLMPNTARGGGISRKITNPQDRKRLKAIAAELEVPDGMGLIIRTAGAARTKQEIKRDYEYLLRLWESVRDLTLQSTAPSLVYEEGNLIKRSIRDLYNKDVEEIVVAGDSAHRDARDFMRMLMPSHAKNVIQHSDAEPLFNKYGIERQLNAMFSPYVTLRSGGYLVINQTEALVAIDVNSGKSTREFSIEETAYNTNLEASDEIARQLKLRDLAGLIVIDFIDMEEKRNNRSVERRLKDALRFDRARIQLGRISHFGLMEMSRQRLRTGVLEGSTSQCPHCQGTGIIRSTESVALAVLRGLEDALMAGQPSSLVATTTAQVALYILNNKRHFITDMESRHGISVTVTASDKLQGANFTIEKGHARPEAPRRPERSVVNMDWGFEGEDDGDAGDDPRPESSRIIEIHDDEDGDERGEGASENGGEDGGRRKRRRRRGRRGGERGGRDFEGRNGRSNGDNRGGPRSASRGDEDQPAYSTNGARAESSPIEGYAGEADDDAEQDAGSERDAGPDGSAQARRDDERGARRRRRGRRGGRRGRGREREVGSDADTGADKPIPHMTEEMIDDFAGATPAEDYVMETDGRDAAAPVRPAAPFRRREIVTDDQPPMPDTAPAAWAAKSPSVNPSAGSAPTIAAPAPIAEAPRDATQASEPQPAPEPRRHYGEPVASEPRIERVVITPDQAAAASESSAERPARKGWWQRRLSGD